MTNCENDYYRSRRSENLGEEGGGAKPEERHAELLRKFLVQTLQVKNLAAIGYPGGNDGVVFGSARLV